MALLNWFFRKAAPSLSLGNAEVPPSVSAVHVPPSSPAKKPDSAIEVQDIGADMLSIPRLKFYGQYRRSPNRRFRLAWRDGEGQRDGARSSGEGQYLLLDGDLPVVNGCMQRPSDGRVANNGTFILNDWHFTSQLTGTFWAFRADGSVILSQYFAANLLNNGLSNDGNFAACHTCNSESETDSAVLALFDLEHGTELARFRPESGWPSDYTFAPEARIIRLCYANEDTNFAYNFAGSFLERDKWINAGLMRSDLYLIRRLLDESSGKPDESLARRILTSIDVGLSQEGRRDDQLQALGWRLRGEAHESLGEFTDALQSYEKALTLNPKIGLKRRVAQIKKILVS